MPQSQASQLDAMCASGHCRLAQGIKRGPGGRFWRYNVSVIARKNPSQLEQFSWVLASQRPLSMNTAVWSTMEIEGQLKSLPPELPPAPLPQTSKSCNRSDQLCLKNLNFRSEAVSVPGL